MTLQDRDKRALVLLGVAAAIAVAILAWPTETTLVRPAAEATAAAERRLNKLRQAAATVPGKLEALKQVSAELAARENGLIQAETAPQAQAQLLQIVRRVGKAQAPPVDMRGGTEIGQARAFGDSYGEVSITVGFECGIEQLLNLVADLNNQPELVASSEMRIGAANPKEKTIPVRLTVTGIVPRRLIPEKKGMGAF